MESTNLRVLGAIIIFLELFKDYAQDRVMSHKVFSCDIN